jgi:multidrug efflux pump subunit AcrA (membrane-fusion protein)
MKKLVSQVQKFIKKWWKKYRELSLWAQIAMGVAVVVLVLGGSMFIKGNGTATESTSLRTVTIKKISAFGGNDNGVSVIGSVRSVTQADILAQSGGTVTAVNTKIGATVPAGYVIASLDNAAQSAAVLQAQGGYQAAVAARNAAQLQSGNAGTSFSEAQTVARNTYESTYSSLQSALQNDIDTLFGGATPIGPQLEISDPITGTDLVRRRQAITNMMLTWQQSIATDASVDPEVLLNNAQTNLNMVVPFVTELSTAAHASGSNATPAQLTALATGNAAINVLVSGLSTERDSYNAKLTAAQVAQTQTGSSNTDVASADAAVTEALGSLRAAQAAYEKTVVRAPIGGTVNYLSLHVGDAVSLNQKVVTVARNNALEVVMYLSQGDSNRIAVGDTVTMTSGNSADAAASYKGVVTTISPALDPVTKQIEVDVAVNDGSDLVNGESVQVVLPSIVAALPAKQNTATTTPATSNIELPLTAVKLLPNERDVFSVDATGHLVANQVQIGDVLGDLIEVMTPLDPNLEIVTDARGLSAGDMVLIASSTAASTPSQ